MVSLCFSIHSNRPWREGHANGSTLRHCSCVLCVGSRKNEDGEEGSSCDNREILHTIDFRLSHEQASM